MAPPSGDGSSPAPIDRSILEFLRTRLSGTRQVETATVSNASGHLELRVVFGSTYYPAVVEEASLSVRWYTNDDFKIHYREQRSGDVWQCRWDRHLNPHNTQDHFHPPPTARTPGDDVDWPTDYRDVLRLVMDTVEERISQLWEA